jgi:hypothetical protein
MCNVIGLGTGARRLQASADVYHRCFGGIVDGTFLYLLQKVT